MAFGAFHLTIGIIFHKYIEIQCTVLTLHDNRVFAQHDNRIFAQHDNRVFAQHSNSVFTHERSRAKWQHRERN